MTKKHLVTGIIVAVVVVGLAFWSGTKYGGGNNNQKNVPTGQRGIGGGTRGGAGFGGGVGGSILSVDSQSIVVQLRSGGSQIVFFTPVTPVLKSVSGSVSDLKTGEDVVVSGTPNQDGSLTAQSIQIRPATTTAPVR